MSGRRGHQRFAVNEPWEGTMRVLREVVVDRTADHELVAVSHAPGVIGEEMSLSLLGAAGNLGVRVRVLESRPLIVDGAVRHRVKLALVTEEDASTASLDVPFLALPDSAGAGTN